ncbi:hypothetical protein BTO06_13120 [Tenacibaculum sp. SZ-18]|uniref:hypothetical protein n=1 Tax=Tenacibaculum sp. SZ-18 TaxID=754423 RepID=UPI000C2D2453|nr:hypothetical protein [Tenacibaculum sp. SZ-18]AUC16039.1 hypothetical protein BTO06_13120 [Tenacibaculum sp. SZ-18]
MKKWIKSGLVWGMIMFIIMTLMYPYFNDEEITTKKILIGFILWTIGGVLFGLTLKRNYEE